MKPYKDESPEKTIIKARNILSDLGIFIIEKHKFKSKHIHTASVEVSSSNLNNLKGYKLKTYGKGNTFEYALASAYGEFFERLQNGILFKNTHYATRNQVNKNINKLFTQNLNKKNAVLEYNYDPREKIVPADKYIEKNPIFLEKIFYTKNREQLRDLILNKLKFKDLICVPFYDSKEKKEIFLPIELLLITSGSNGMSAGNTSEEAIIQGICEIFERFALKKVYFNKLIPPTIPLEYFKDNKKTIKMLKQLENQGLDIIIKDFSLGKNIPVIGILILDKINNKYNVKVGSDVVPNRALQRCLTEFYQSSTIPNLSLIENIDEYKKHKLENRYYDFINYKYISNFSSGNWHRSFFSNEFSYKFEGFDKNLGQSHKQDIIYLKKLIKNFDTNIYIRNVSFLGFKSFYVYIPKLSDYQTNKIDDYNNFIEFKNQKEKLLSIKKLNNLELLELTNCISKWLEINPNFWRDFIKPSFGYHSKEDLLNLDVNLFLSMAHYKLNNLDLSIQYLDIFLNEFCAEDRSSYLYFYACLDYFKMKKDNLSIEKIHFFMQIVYPMQLVEEVVLDLYDSNKIFKFQKLPTCYECESCEISKYCNYFDVMKMVKVIQNTQTNNSIEQINLNKII